MTISAIIVKRCFEFVFIPSTSKLNKWQSYTLNSKHQNLREVFRFFLTSSSTAPTAAPIHLSAFTSDYSTVILSWDPVPKGHVNGELLGHKVVVNGSDNILFAAPCFSSLELNDVNVSSDTCIRMAAVTKVGIGPMTNCTQIDFGRFSFCLCTARAGLGESLYGYYIVIRNITRSNYKRSTG